MGALREAMEGLRESLAVWGAAPVESAMERQANYDIRATARKVLDAYDARRARKAARAKPAAGERAAVDAAAFDAAMAAYDKATSAVASVDFGNNTYTPGGASSIHGQNPEPSRRARDAARAALRALVLGDGGAP